MFTFINNGFSVRYIGGGVLGNVDCENNVSNDMNKYSYYRDNTEFWNLFIQHISNSGGA